MEESAGDLYKWASFPLPEKDIMSLQPHSRFPRKSILIPYSVLPSHQLHLFQGDCTSRRTASITNKSQFPNRNNEARRLPPRRPDSGTSKRLGFRPEHGKSFAYPFYHFPLLMLPSAVHAGAASTAMSRAHTASALAAHVQAPPSTARVAASGIPTRTTGGRYVRWGRVRVTGKTMNDSFRMRCLPYNINSVPAS